MVSWMAKVVWKETLDIIARQVVEVPDAAKVLCAEIQYEKLCLWFLCDPELEKTQRVFRIVGTGHEISDELQLKYISSFMLAHDALIFHVFEEQP